MLRLVAILPVLVWGDAHGDVEAGCSAGRANIVAKTGICPTGYSEDVAGTNAPATEAPATQAPTTAAPTAAAATTAAATAAPVTKAATTAPPTAAATTAAPAGNASGNGTNGTNSSRMLMDEFNFPIVRKMAAHASNCYCKKDEVSANDTNGTAPQVAVITTAISMTMSLDLTDFSDDQKTATGNSIAYGIHVTACNGIKTMWKTMAQCMMGKGKVKGVEFEMGMAIDAALVGTGTQPGCSGINAPDCYGGAAPADRRLSATTLTNAATFKIEAKAANAADLISAAESELKTNDAALKDASSLMANVQKAMARPAMKATLGNLTNAIETAVAAATITATATRTGAGAPVAASSNAYTAAVSGVFMVVVGALLM